MWHEMVNYTSDSYLRYSIYYFCKGKKNQKILALNINSSTNESQTEDVS